MTSVVVVDKSILTSPVDKAKVGEQEGSSKAGRKIQSKALYKVWEWSRQGMGRQVAGAEGKEEFLFVHINVDTLEIDYESQACRV